ncbi:hypothetical protein PUN28_015749 [Cardiocondyla obscurior]|uniref:Uncharacterized protein n=1 Tax=Cardiocondyla obscurior TaxID=286306 RepID=A0AAW2EYC7_9HYME
MALGVYAVTTDDSTPSQFLINIQLHICMIFLSISMIPVASSDFEKIAIILINYINFSYGNNCFFWCARFYFSVCFSVARFTLVFKSLYYSHNPVSRLQ